MNTYLAIFIGGGIGSLMRYGIGAWLTQQFPGSFPLGTLSANLLSCILLGAALTTMNFSSGMWKLFLVVGVCGGFSTFSSFSYENVVLIKSGEWLFAIANIIISISLCIFTLFIFSKYWK